MTKFLTRDDIAQHDGCKVEEMEAWGGKIRLKEITSEDSDSYQRAVRSQMVGVDDLDMTGLRVLLLSKCIADANGKKMFDDEEGRALLAKKDGKTINTLFIKCAMMNGIGQEGLEELRKNLERTQKKESGSDSQES